MASGALGVGERINGVNLGNWLVLERWMKPGIFAASGEADEIWLHRATKSAELEALLTRHRDTYITEADFRNIAAHGCNLVRIPVPYFVFGDVPGHPGCTEYLDRAFDWAERTGLKILIDLHTVPGSQNGFDNGGLTGVVRWHRSPRAVAYALDVLVRLARRYRDHAALFGIEVLNEPIDWLTYAMSPSVFRQVGVSCWGWCRFVGLVVDSITTNHATRPSSRRRSMMLMPNSVLIRLSRYQTM